MPGPCGCKPHAASHLQGKLPCGVQCVCQAFTTDCDWCELSHRSDPQRYVVRHVGVSLQAGTSVQVPLAMDVSGEYIVLACDPLEITVLRVSLTGELTLAGTASASFQLVRQLSIVSPGHPLQVRTLGPGSDCKRSSSFILVQPHRANVRGEYVGVQGSVDSHSSCSNGLSGCWCMACCCTLLHTAHLQSTACAAAAGRLWRRPAYKRLEQAQSHPAH